MAESRAGLSWLPKAAAPKTGHPSRLREQGHVRIRPPFNRIPSQPVIPSLFLRKVPGTDLPISFFSTTISRLNQTVSFCVPIKYGTQSQLLKTHGPTGGFYLFFFLKRLYNVVTEKEKSKLKLRMNYLKKAFISYLTLYQQIPKIQ